MKVKLKSLGIGALSIRENEVLRLASEGFTDDSICRILGIAQGTLGTYWVRIRNKTTLTTRAELAAAHTRYRGDRMLVRTIQVVAERVTVYGEASEPSASEIFEALPVATLVVRSDGSILAANLMAGKLLGRKASARSSLISHLLPRDVQSFLYSLQLAAATDLEPRLTACVVAPSGTKSCNWLIKRLSPESSLLLLLVSEPEPMLAAVMLQTELAEESLEEVEEV